MPNGVSRQPLHLGGDLLNPNHCSYVRDKAFDQGFIDPFDVVARVKDLQGRSKILILYMPCLGIPSIWNDKSPASNKP